jgi:adenosylhomocysteine nucleosidase
MEDMPDKSICHLGETKTPPFKKLLLLASMEAEEQAVLSQASFVQEVISPSLKLTIHLQSIGGTTVGVAHTQVGLVNAGAALALLCDKIDFDAGLLIGIAGALSPNLRTGQLVLSRKVIQHDSVAWTPDGMLLIPPGEPHLTAKAEKVRPSAIPCADVLLDYLFALVADNASLKPVVGPVLSGSEFTGTRQRKLELASRYPGALSVDMEAAGAALIAKRLKLPFVAAKTVADELEHELSPVDFKRVAREALANTTLFTGRLFAALEQSPNNCTPLQPYYPP